MQDETLSQLLKAHDEGIAKAERERIANRQTAAKECPPLYARCCEFERPPRRSCVECWLDWLAADE